MEVINSKECKVDVQICTELYYSKKSVITRIEGFIARHTEIQPILNIAIQDVHTWATSFDGYASKRSRLDILLNDNDIDDLVLRALVSVVELDNRSDLLVSISSKVAASIKGMTKLDAVKTAGEILVIMCDADLINLEQDTNQYTKNGQLHDTTSWYVVSPWQLDETTSKHIARAMYLPPMIVQPQKIKANNHSGYLTKGKESVILGSENHHDGEQNLANINRFNSVELSLNIDMLKFVTEELLNDEEKRKAINSSAKRREQYDNLMRQSYHVFAYLVKNDNKFFLTHSYDMRGRTYSGGYHCNTQGDAFRKSIVEFAKKEKVTGNFD